MNKSMPFQIEEFPKKSRKLFIPKLVKKYEFFGIQLKPGYSLSNIIAIPLMNAVIAITNFYFTIGIVFLLKDRSLFALDED